VKIFAIRGIPIFVHGSWLVIYALITWTLAVGYFPRVLPELPPAAYWANGLIAAALLFVSVLLHELSHSFVATAHGLQVRGITLHVFGGVSHLEDEAPSPRAEFLIAVVGPLTSFAIAGLLWTVGGTGLAGEGSVHAVLDYVVLVNVAVGVFNLIPGFPLDGGRILRAVLWRWKGGLGVATWIASRVGVGFAFLLMAAGMLRVFTGALVDGFWLVLIGLFLRNAADASYAQIALREALGKLAVRAIMARDVVTVPGDGTVAELVDGFWAHHYTSFPVVDGGAVTGIASLQQVHRVPRDAWATTRIRDVMLPVNADLVIGPRDSAFEALQRATRNPVGRLAVVDGGRLVGYLSLKDVTHVLALEGLAPAGAGHRARLASERIVRRAA
jgi:Zn-dependent protease/CBS domain-containing protein